MDPLRSESHHPDLDDPQLEQHFESKRCEKQPLDQDDEEQNEQ